MIGSSPNRNTLVSRLSSKIIPLEAPCQDIPEFPVSKGQVAHILVIGVAQNAIIKNKMILSKSFPCSHNDASLFRPIFINHFPNNLANR